jgi:F-type H+-transporting ATPase subunit b
MKPYGEKVIVFIFLLAAFSLFFYGPVLAASESTPADVHGSSQEGAQPDVHESGDGEGHSADRSADLRDLLYRFINFALLVIILIWALKKADIKGLFSKRIEDIRRKLDTLKKEKEEAEQRYQASEKKLKAFEKERTEILEQYKKDGEAEKERIIAEANLRVQQIIEQSEATIQQEIQSAKNRLKQDVVNLAAQKAQEIIAREMKDEDQERLVQDFIERVGKIH